MGCSNSRVQVPKLDDGKNILSDDRLKNLFVHAKFPEEAEPEQNSNSANVAVHGINLLFLVLWAEANQVSPNTTTASVCNQLILPNYTTSSFSRTHMQDGFRASTDTLPIVKHTATHYVCHARSCGFLNMLEAIKHSIAPNNLRMEEVYVWLDVFALDQNLSMRQSNVQDRQHCIQTIGNTLLVFDDSKQFVPLHDVLCVWELYQTAQCNANLTICEPSTPDGGESSQQERWLGLILHLDTYGTVANLQCKGEMNTEDFEDVYKSELSELSMATSTVVKLISSAVKHSTASHYPKDDKSVLGNSKLLSIPSSTSSSVNMLILYGLIELLLGNQDKCITLTSKALDLNLATVPNTIEASVQQLICFRCLGECYLERNELELCLEYCTKFCRLYDSHTNQMSSIQLLLATVLYIGGLCLSKLGRYQNAREYQDKCLQLRRNSLGDRHFATKLSMKHLAELECKLGNLANAAKLYREILKDDKTDAGLSNFRFCLNSLGLFKEELETYSGTEIPAPENNALDNAQQLHHKAFLLKELGQFENALKLETIAHQLVCSNVEESHPLVSESCSNLGILHKLLGNLDDAKQLQLRALKLGTKELKSVHSKVALIHVRLGEIAVEKGQYLVADEHALTALSLQQVALEPGNVQFSDTYLLQAKIDLAYFTRNARWRSGTAMQLTKSRLQDTLNIRLLHFVATHPSVATVHVAIAKWELCENEVDRAREHLQQALSIQQKALGKASVVTMETQELLETLVSTQPGELSDVGRDSDSQPESNFLKGNQELVGI